MNVLSNQAGMLKQLLHATVKPESETTLAIELPETADFEELQEVIADIGAFLASMTGLPVGEGDERMQPPVLDDFDVGSKWLLVKASSVAALRFIGFLLRGIFFLADWGRQKQAEANLLAEFADDTKSATELNKKLRLKLAREIAGSIKEKAAPKATNEEINRIAALLTEGEKLVERRVQLLPSLKAPPETRKAFPPVAAQRATVEALPGIAMKLLGAGDDVAASDGAPE